jgi:hypothetical protein
MSTHPDQFSDLLEPGETVQAMLGGAGRDHKGEPTWFQFALTENRVLAVLLTQAEVGESYQPSRRLAAPRDEVQVARYPQTEDAPSRLEIRIHGEALTLPNLDQADLFPQVEPFVQAWGQPVDGMGSLFMGSPEASAQPQKKDHRLLLITAAIAAAVFFLCCAGSGLVMLATQFSELSAQ